MQISKSYLLEILLLLRTLIIVKLSFRFQALPLHQQTMNRCKVKVTKALDENTAITTGLSSRPSIYISTFYCER